MIGEKIYGMVGRFILLSFLLYICLMSFVSASVDVYMSESYVLNQEISNTINFIPQKSDYKMNYFMSNLSLVPHDDYRQKVKSFSTDPSSIRRDDYVTFRFTELQPKTLSLKLNSEISTSGDFVKINNKVDFPLTYLHPDLLPYLDEQETIDFNNGIKRQAQQIVGSEDDLFIVEFLLSDWVNKNIQYNLSSLTAQANEKSSWVYENRYGVCDEITNLFISMNRQLGIPARFVSGVAYTNVNLNDWGNHGWAEVYFPGHGWVPFDVTYGEYGYVDATHISLQKSLDSKESSIYYITEGRGYEFKPQALNFKTSIVESGPKKTPIVDMDVYFLEDEVGFGSYNLVILNITSEVDYYISEKIQISQTTDLEILDTLQQEIALKPHESKLLTWKLHVNNDLNDDFVYTFPFIIKDSRNQTIELSFKSRFSGPHFTKAYVESFEKQDISNANEKLSLDCTSSKSTFYKDASTTINCEVSSKFDDDKIGVLCVDTVCDSITFSSGKEIFSKDFSINQGGISTIIVKLEVEGETIENFITLHAVETPSINIKDLDVPTDMTFNDIKPISFTAEKINGDPKDITVELVHPLMGQYWSFDDFESDKRFEILVVGQNFVSQSDYFEMIIKYKDALGKDYVEQFNVTISLNDVTVVQRILLFFNSMSGGLNNFVSYITSNRSTSPEQTKFVNILFILIIGWLLVLSFITKSLKNLKVEKFYKEQLSDDLKKLRMEEERLTRLELKSKKKK